MPTDRVVPIEGRRHRPGRHGEAALLREHLVEWSAHGPAGADVGLERGHRAGRGGVDPEHPGRQRHEAGHEEGAGQVLQQRRDQRAPGQLVGQHVHHQDAEARPQVGPDQPSQRADVRWSLDRRDRPGRLDRHLEGHLVDRSRSPPSPSVTTSRAASVHHRLPAEAVRAGRVDGGGPAGRRRRPDVAPHHRVVGSGCGWVGATDPTVARRARRDAPRRSETSRGMLSR